MEGIDVMRPASTAQATTALFNNDVQPDDDQPRWSMTQALPPLTQSMAEGQIVIICARWLLVLAALLLTLWSPGPDALADIRLRVPVLLLLAVANFYLHAQVLMRRPVAANIIYAASVADIIVITLLLLAQGSFASPL